ncbi:TetR/AcrR family transcriptional regulator [Nonomuraea sp. CA-143628]|uniref:TetR/AcrR family transcriptional regulator n=1 Tax=Nonomuraea sp. CA-143628 TaxID=3239997 RepID=UPI003D8B6ADB
MPRYVDHQQRRKAIMDATLEILARGGTEGMSFRKIAERLGGSSTTVVTHYYRTQRELLDDLTARLTAQWEDDIRTIDAASQDPRERLRQLLIWFVPASEADVTTERARIQLLAHDHGDDVFRASFRRWDRMMREHLRRHLGALVPQDRVDGLVDLLRVFTGGVVLSVLEYPGEWPPERQESVVDGLMQLVDGVIVEAPAT